MEKASPAVEKALNLLADGDASGCVKLIQAAIEKGDPGAFEVMGSLYQKGIGVEQSFTKARQWWERAVEHGLASAMLLLSVLCLQGKGGERNFSRAVELMERAGATGLSNAYVMLGSMYQHGKDGAEQNLALASAYYEKGVALHNPTATLYLGNLLICDQGLFRDVPRGFKLYETAAEMDDPEALFYLGYLCATGTEGYPEDHQRAEALNRRAARGGFEEARRMLQRFPPVVEMGQIVISPSFRRLDDEDQMEMFRRHASGYWGDVDLKTWDENDRALLAGERVESIHEAPDGSFVVMGQTEGDRKSSFFKLLVEEEKPVGWNDVWEAAKKMKNAYRIVKFFNGMGG